jgi:hypothetical protein
LRHIRCYGWSLIHDPVIVIAILVGLLAAYSFGEWVGREKARIRRQRSASSRLHEEAAMRYLSLSSSSP